ncbi:MAG: amidohydrolase [Chitinophagaceae bacterium]|nr:amidohydrolase [Chitinophagaceae bacterium]
MKYSLIVIFLWSSFLSTAQIKPAIVDFGKQYVQHSIEVNSATYISTAKQIWGAAELGYREFRSSNLLQQLMTTNGFTVEAGVAGIPTAFTAFYGNGKPVIAILAEYDALPGLSQDTVAARKPLIDGGSGHGCGHNLFGSASAAAAIAVKEWLASSGNQGSIRLYGTPAEEGGGAKVYMAREGLFKDVDIVLHWHPSDANNANAESSLAVKTGMFRFYGKASHSAAAPENGRSAVDAVESMDLMVNMMREHISPDARVHYVITNGGKAANVVPDFAEVEYYVRHPDVKEVLNIWDRVVKAAEGAALGTETIMKYEVITGLYNLLPNQPLGMAMYNNLKKVGGIKYDAKETLFAEKIQSSFGYPAPPIIRSESVTPFAMGFYSASTDVGDISWQVPTVGLGVATWVPGTSAHSWQAVATNGMSIGFKAMINAAKTIAMTALDLYTNPALIEAAKADWLKRKGDFQYKTLVGDRKPPLDYRK